MSNSITAQPFQSVGQPTGLRLPRAADRPQAGSETQAGNRAQVGGPTPVGNRAQAGNQTQAGDHKVAALKDQIRREKVQLNDWVTCVSAKTTKGQSEIRSLSAQISGAQQHIEQLNNSQSTQDGQASARIDVWV